MSGMPTHEGPSCLPTPHRTGSFRLEATPQRGEVMDLALIKQAALFSTLEEDELAAVGEICKEQNFKFGQHIFKEGEPGNRLFIISKGDVRISRQVPGSGEEALTVL